MKKYLLIILSIVAVLTTSCEKELQKQFFGRVIGLVHDNNGAEIPGALVQLYKDGVVVKQQVSDDNGFYEFESLESGSYTIMASTNDYESETYEIYVSQGETFRQYVLFNIAGSIYGMVIDEESQPLMDAVVELYDEYGDRVDSLVADKEGFYSFRGVNDGQYSIKAYSAGKYIYESDVYKGREDFLYHIKMEDGVLLGKAILSNGINANNAYVVVLDGDTKYIDVNADAQGEFALGGFGNKEYTISIGYRENVYSFFSIEKKVKYIPKERVMFILEDGDGI